MLKLLLRKIWRVSAATTFSLGVFSPAFLTWFISTVYSFLYSGEVVIEMEKADAKSFMRRFSCGVVVLSSTYLPTAYLYGGLLST